MSRDARAAKFLANAGWSGATRRTVAGDASNRRYDRLSKGAATVILMDAPPEKGEDVRPFVAITELLRTRGLSAPKIHAVDEANGFLLLEDLGDAGFARVLEASPELENRLYSAAIDVLVHLQSASAPDLPAYDTAMMTDRALLAFDWYQMAATGSVDDAARDAAAAAFTTLLEPILPSVLIQRDYHAENLIWLPEREGVARVGLLDYQDALIGHPAYDLCSILLDARRDVPDSVQEAMLARYIDAARVTDAAAFMRAYHALSLQRNMRIMGVFARLCVRDGKAHYVDLLPRVWRHVEAALDGLGDTPLNSAIRAALPAPSPEICERIKAQCATYQTP